MRQLAPIASGVRRTIASICAALRRAAQSSSAVAKPRPIASARGSLLDQALMILEPPPGVENLRWLLNSILQSLYKLLHFQGGAQRCHETIPGAFNSLFDSRCSRLDHHCRDDPLACEWGNPLLGIRIFAETTRRNQHVASNARYWAPRRRLASNCLADSIEPPGGQEMKAVTRASLVGPRRAASQARRRWFRTGAMNRHNGNLRTNVIFLGWGTLLGYLVSRRLCSRSGPAAASFGPDAMPPRRKRDALGSRAYQPKLRFAAQPGAARGRRMGRDSRWRLRAVSTRHRHRREPPVISQSRLCRCWDDRPRLPRPTGT